MRWTSRQCSALLNKAHGVLRKINCLNCRPPRVRFDVFNECAQNEFPNLASAIFVEHFESSKSAPQKNPYIFRLMHIFILALSSSNSLYLINPSCFPEGNFNPTSSIGDHGEWWGLSVAFLTLQRERYWDNTFCAENSPKWSPLFHFWHNANKSPMIRNGGEKIFRVTQK